MRRQDFRFFFGLTVGTHRERKDEEMTDVVEMLQEEIKTLSNLLGKMTDAIAAIDSRLTTLENYLARNEEP